MMVQFQTFYGCSQEKVKTLLIHVFLTDFARYSFARIVTTLLPYQFWSRPLYLRELVATVKVNDCFSLFCSWFMAYFHAPIADTIVPLLRLCCWLEFWQSLNFDAFSSSTLSWLLVLAISLFSRLDTYIVFLNLSVSLALVKWPNFFFLQFNFFLKAFNLFLICNDHMPGQHGFLLLSLFMFLSYD